MSAIEIKDFNSLLIALRARHDFFHSHGCRVSDHGIETAYAEDNRDSKIRYFSKNSRKEKV